MTIKERILEEQKNNNVVIIAWDGLHTYSLDNILDQPVAGLLYDLNRDPATILTFVDKDPKWINDYACMRVITTLKEQVERLQELNDRLR